MTGPGVYISRPPFTHPPQGPPSFLTIFCSFSSGELFRDHRKTRRSSTPMLCFAVRGCIYQQAATYPPTFQTA